MKTTLEREVKLRGGAHFGGVQLPGRPLAERTLVSTYHDTDDLRLAAGSITLRRRDTVGGESVWQVKLGEGPARTELEWEAQGEHMPDVIVRLLTAHTRGRPLHPVATLRTIRTGVLVQRNGTDVAEVTEDRVDVVEDGRTLRSFDEIEAELVDGDGRDLRRLEKALRRAGAVDPNGRPKLFQALDLRRPSDPDPPEDGPAGALHAALVEQYGEILKHDPGTRIGDDPEQLHDHRVAVRRLRALLRSGRPLLDRQWADELRRSLKQAGRALADVRDLDVLVADVARQAAELDEPERAGAHDIVQRLIERRDAAQAALARSLTEPWYVSLLNRVEQAVATPRFDGNGSLRKAARKAHRRAAKLVSKLPAEPTDAQLHEVRKAVKRSRYAAELARAAGISGTRRYVKRAKAVQDVLGGHQDAVVAARTLDSLDADLRRPAAHMATQTLIRMQEERRAAARAAFPRAWKRLDKRGRALA